MMKLNIQKELAAMDAMTVGQLQARYVEVFGEVVRSRHKAYLIRRIAWRLQANAEGGLSERALARAAELARDSDVRVTPPKGRGLDDLGANGRGAGHRGSNDHAFTKKSDLSDRPVRLDPRLPSVGSQITRRYKGKTLVVTVRADGFDYLGECYASLSAIAKSITGSHMNGYRFFGLERGR